MSSTTLSRSHRAVVVTLVCLAAGAVLFAGGVAADGFAIDIDEINGGDPINVDDQDDVTVVVNITNTADSHDAQDIRVTIDDSDNTELTREDDVLIDPDDNEDEFELEFDTDHIPQDAYGDDGEITISVETDDDSDSEDVDIEFDNYVIDEFDPDEVVPGENAWFNASIVNKGNIGDDNPIDMQIDGLVIDSETVDTDDDTSVNFSAEVPDSGEFNVTINSTNDGFKNSSNSETRTITVLEPAEPRIDSIVPDTVRGGEEVDITYTVVNDEAQNKDAELTITDPNGDPFRNFTVQQGSEETQDFTMPSREDEEFIEGDWSATIDIERSFSDSATFTADTVQDPGNVEFSQDVYRTPAGDFVEIDVSVEDLDEAYLLIGGDREANSGQLQNHLDILHIDGDATFVINTRLVGTESDSSDVYIPVEGEVTSYAHELGADAEPQGEFEDVSFENERGDEVATDLAEFREEIGLHDRGGPLHADRYRLVAGGSGTVMIRDDDIPDFRQPVDRSNLNLIQPELEAVNTYVLPPGPADKVDRFEDDEDEVVEMDDIGTLLADATERETVARGDRILIEVQATGMFGAAMANQSDHPVIDDDEDDNFDIRPGIAELRNNPEGVSIDFSTARHGGPAHRDSTLQFSGVGSSEFYIIPDDTADQWEDETRVGDDPMIGGAYFIIDTRESDPFDNQPRFGDELEFEIAYESPPDERYAYEPYDLTEGDKPDPFKPEVESVDGVELFPYFSSHDTTVSENSTFEFLEPDVQYDRTIPDGDVIVPAEDDGRILGSTNIAPGSDVTIQLIASDRPDPEIIEIEDVDVDEDGFFDTTADFSSLEPGERVEVEFYTPGRTIDTRIIDKRGAHVVEELDNPAVFEIESLEEDVTVQQRESLADIQATITNTGGIVDRQTVEFTVANETLSEERVTLGPNGTTTLDLSDQFVTLPVGEYEYTVETDDDEQTGQLTVTPPDSGTEITSADSDAATSESPLGDDELPGDDTDDGLFAFVGVTSRDVAVATAVAGVVHVLGSFT